MGNPSTGVVRHNITPYGNSQTPGNPGDWETRPDVQAMKAVTGWDPDRYLNMWTIRPGGNALDDPTDPGLSGLLGYAQFPSNSGLAGLNTNGGAANTDGVVAGFSVMGTRDLDDGSFILNGTYDLGRTMTHEVGHWVGLRHIWGDNGACAGGTAAGDFCADTPDSTSPNYSCVTVDKCTADGLGNDQVQNYMDYTNDACMDTFTQNQKDRVMAVFMNSPRRGILNSSIACNAAGPTVNFATTAPASMTEGSDCAFTDYTFDLSMTTGSSASTVASFTQTGTAGSSDYELIDNSVTFAAGSSTATGNNTITLRIYNDSFVENDETIILEVNVTTTGDAIATLAKKEILIMDDDADLANSSSVIFTEDMETNANLSVYDGDAASPSTFFVTTSLDVPSGALNGQKLGAQAVATEATTNDYAILRVPFTIPAGATSLDITQALVSVNQPQEFEMLFATSIATIADFTAGLVIDSGTAIPYTGADVLQTTTIDPIALRIDGQTGYLVLRHTGGPGGAQNDGFILWDNVTLTAVTVTNVETNVSNASSQDESYINGDGISVSNSRDNVTGNAIASIRPDTAYNFECTTVGISRAGTSAQGFNGSTGADQVTDKTFTITPASPNTAATISIDFYFTEAELTGWETATGLNRSELGIKKVGPANNQTVAAGIAPFGSDWKVTGVFTQGMEGTYYFGRQSSLSTESNQIVNNLNIYPNPANNELNIGFDSNGSDVVLSLFDIRGRRVLSANKANNSNKFQTQLNVSNLETGVYLLNITDSAINVTKKIVIE